MISSSVEKNDGSAFEGRPSLQTVSFEPNSNAKTITTHAFADCTELTGVVTPSSVKSIESGMYSPFLRCDSLSVIYYGGSEEEWEEFFGKPSNVDVYYYSEGEPTGGGKYWRYDENFLPVAWN